eukprot:gene3228-13251_t
MKSAWNNLVEPPSTQRDASMPEELQHEFRLDPFGNVISLNAVTASICYFNSDHIFPWSRGGLTKASNLVEPGSSIRCHRRRSRAQANFITTPGCMVDKLAVISDSTKQHSFTGGAWKQHQVEPGNSISRHMSGSRVQANFIITRGTTRGKWRVQKLKDGLQFKDFLRLWGAIKKAVEGGVDMSAAAAFMHLLLCKPWSQLGAQSKLQSGGDMDVDLYPSSEPESDSLSLAASDSDDGKPTATGLYADQETYAEDGDAMEVIYSDPSRMHTAGDPFRMHTALVNSKQQLATLKNQLIEDKEHEARLASMLSASIENNQVLEMEVENLVQHEAQLTSMLTASIESNQVLEMEVENLVQAVHETRMPVSNLISDAVALMPASNVTGYVATIAAPPITSQDPSDLQVRTNRRAYTRLIKLLRERQAVHSATLGELAYVKNKLGAVEVDRRKAEYCSAKLESKDADIAILQRLLASAKADVASSGQYNNNLQASSGKYNNNPLYALNPRALLWNQQPAVPPTCPPLYGSSQYQGYEHDGGFRVYNPLWPELPPPPPPLVTEVAQDTAYTPFGQDVAYTPFGQDAAYTPFGQDAGHRGHVPNTPLPGVLYFPSLMTQNMISAYTDNMNGVAPQRSGAQKDGSFFSRMFGCFGGHEVKSNPRRITPQNKQQPKMAWALAPGDEFEHQRGIPGPW